MLQDNKNIEKNKNEILNRAEKKTSIILKKALENSIENINKSQKNNKWFWVICGTIQKNMNFMFISEYESNEDNLEIVIYKKR